MGDKHGSILPKRSRFDEALALLDGTIPWTGTALNTAKDINTSIPKLFIKYFHDCPTVEEVSAFIFYSRLKGLRDSIVGNTVLHEVNSRQWKIESHTVPVHGIQQYEEDEDRWIRGVLLQD